MTANRPIRVLFLIENVPYSLDTRVQREADVVKRMGGEVVVVCPTDGGGFHTTIDGFNVYQYPKPHPGRGFIAHLAEYFVSLFFHFWLVAYVAIRHGFDVIHGANPPDIFWIIAAPYKLFGKRFIFDQHDLVPELFDVRYRDRLPVLRRTMLWMEKRSMAMADHVIATNESFRNVALTRGGKRSAEVTIVRNGPWIGRHFTDVEPAESVKSLGSVTVGYIGWMNPQDHLENLMEVARIIRVDKGRDDIGFILIGSGDSYPSLVKIRDEKGLGESVRMPGTIPWKEAVSALSATDICVQPDLPTSFNVNLTMNKLMEYMALGKATVAYEMTETCFTGADTVVYVKDSTAEALAESIIRLADDPQLRRNLGDKAKARIDSLLCWERQSEHLVSVYEAVKPASTVLEPI
ncbi:MAG: glycosyltransferase family 4 protein [Woeseiaceae bacterium]